MSSIRAYLLTRLLGGAAIVLALAGYGIYLVVASSLEAQFDRSLVDRAQGFVSILFQTSDNLAFHFSDELMPEYEREVRPDYFEIRFEDGSLLEASNSLGDGELELDDPPSEEAHTWTASLPDGRTGRYVSQLMEIHHVFPELGPDRPDAHTVLVIVARGIEDLEASERNVLLICFFVWSTLMALLAFLAWAAVREGLGPARRLAEALDAIEVDRLPERFELGELPRELQPIARKTDALVRRVDSALERERRTTADIAHELRTPISELITVAEVALRAEEDSDGAIDALEIVRGVAWRMGGSVSTLLKLARLDMGAETFAREPVDLGVVVAEALRSEAIVERGRAIRIDNGTRPGLHVVGDPDVIRIVVSNLVSNALHYAPKRSAVTCAFELTEDGACLSIENAASELDARDVAAVTRPFWRKDRAREDRSRSGLGLALSSALAERCGLELSFELVDAHFRATLRMPHRRPGESGLPAGNGAAAG